MAKLTFPKPYPHNHPPVQNVNELIKAQSSFGQRAADTVANTVGSWAFLITQTVLLTFWIVLNAISWIQHWDPYPFILMNLVLSTQAAFTAPIIMMSQNRQAAKDRIEAHNDFEVNQKAEVEIRAILEHLQAQDIALQEIHALLAALQQDKGKDV